jgi:flagellar biosynthesis protein FlhA
VSSFPKILDFLTDQVRVALGRQITSDLIDQEKNLSVITIDPEIETIIRSSIHEDPVEGRILALDPESHNMMLQSLVEAFSKCAGRWDTMAIYLVSPQIRTVIFTMLEREIPAPVVLSYNEISNNINVNVVGSALLNNAA